MDQSDNSAPASLSHPYGRPVLKLRCRENAGLLQHVDKSFFESLGVQKMGHKVPEGFRVQPELRSIKANAYAARALCSSACSRDTPFAPTGVWASLQGVKLRGGKVAFYGLDSPSTSLSVPPTKLLRSSGSVAGLQVRICILFEKLGQGSLSRLGVSFLQRPLLCRIYQAPEAVMSHLGFEKRPFAALIALKGHPHTTCRGLFPFAPASCPIHGTGLTYVTPTFKVPAFRVWVSGLQEFEQLLSCGKMDPLGRAPFKGLPYTGYGAI